MCLLLWLIIVILQGLGIYIVGSFLIDWYSKRKIYRELDEHAWRKGFINWKALVDWWCDKGWKIDPEGKIFRDDQRRLNFSDESNK